MFTLKISDDFDTCWIPNVTHISRIGIFEYNGDYEEFTNTVLENSSLKPEELNRDPDWGEIGPLFPLIMVLNKRHKECLDNIQKWGAPRVSLLLVTSPLFEGHMNQRWYMISPATGYLMNEQGQTVDKI